MTAIRHPGDGLPQSGYAYPYFSGEGFLEDVPLQRFLPPLTRGAMAYGLSSLAPGRNWVIDPFGASPHIALEAARAGYKTLVICNNPILQLYLEMLCSAPRQADFNAALADFAIEKQDQTRLETYLKGLYLTICPRCGSEIPAQSYSWRKEPLQLRTKIIACPHCGLEDELAVEDADLQRLSASGLDALHRARALQRVNINPEVHKAAEEVSEVYTARSLNFLFTFINRIERMDISAWHKNLLYAVSITLLDEGNTMWSWPPGKTRPKILSTAGQFREQNLWLLLEKAIDQWNTLEEPVPFSVWPDLPAGETGVCLYKGRISAFRAEYADNPLPFSAAFTAFPRPNQAFWSLTAVWAGWLWGKNAVLPMKSALERRRFDWAWYTAAVHQTLSGLQEILPTGAPFLGMIGEAETSFLASTLFAAANTSFSLKNCALRVDEEIAQFVWEKSVPQARQAAAKGQKPYSGTIQQALRVRNEPVEELEATAACLVELARGGLLSSDEHPIPYTLVRDTQQEIANLLNDAGSFTRMQVPHSGQEKRLYWAGEPRSGQAALADAVESAFIELFTENREAGLMEIDRWLCRRFPGLLTPAAGLLNAVVNAYTTASKERQGMLILKPELQSGYLAEIAEHLGANLAKLGSRLGYMVTGGAAIHWRESDTLPHYRLHVITNANISLLAYEKQETGTRVIIYPDALEELLEYKIGMNSLLAGKAPGFPDNHSVRIIPYHKIADLCRDENAQRSDFLSLLEGGLPSQRPSQISFFPFQ